MVTDEAPVPVVISTFVAKTTEPDVEVLRRTDTVLLVKLAVTISGFVSPSKSPMAIEDGPVPVEISFLGLKMIPPASVTLKGWAV